MVKKILPALIGATLAATTGMAAADVQLVGHIDTSIDSVDQDGGPKEDLNFGCTTCSVGFKGSEDLGNGLKAIFFIDFQYDTTDVVYRDEEGDATSDNTVKDRDQWLGLSGVFGQVRIGTISTLYKSHGAMIDPLYRTALQGRDHGLQSNFHSGAGEELQGRATNTARWDSPDYNGFKVGAHYTLDGEEGDGEDEDPYGIGGSYENGGILVFADYMDNGQDDDAEKNAWKVGGKYDMGLFSFMGQYEDYDDQTDADADKTLWQIAAGVNGLLGMNIFVGYGQGDDDESDADYTAWTLAVSHDFSKNTMIYAGHSQVDCDETDTSTSPCNFGNGSGGETDQTSFGIKHKF